MLYALLDRVVDGYYPVVAGLGNDIDEIETEVFSGDPQVSRRIYELSREVAEFKRSTRPLAGTLAALTAGFLKYGIDEVHAGDERFLISVSSWRSRGRSDWRAMSRTRALVVALAVGLLAFAAGRLLAGAAEPDLPEPIVVEEPGGVAPGQSTTTTSQPVPSTSTVPSIVPPPTVGPTSPPPGDDDDAVDGSDNDDEHERGVTMTERRRFRLSARLRILGWILALTTLAVVGALVLSRRLLLEQLDAEVTDHLEQELDEIRVLAGGRDPETGQPFGADVAAIFDTFLGRNVPGEGEALYTFVDGSFYKATQAPVPLFEEPEAGGRWAELDGPGSR